MQHAILAGIAPPNSGTQKSQQVKNCVVNFYNSAAGQAVQFGSPLGGGAYFYAGKEISAGPAHGFAGAITEFDSRSGLSKGALFEAGGGEGIGRVNPLVQSWPMAVWVYPPQLPQRRAALWASAQVVKCQVPGSMAKVLCSVERSEAGLT
jgi:hypothetical protein